MKTIFIVLFSVIFTACILSCTSIEPKQSDKTLGDKAWNRVQCCYDPHWTRWQKFLYWLGPGHCPPCLAVIDTGYVGYHVVTGKKIEVMPVPTPCPTPLPWWTYHGSF